MPPSQDAHIETLDLALPYACLIREVLITAYRSPQMPEAPIFGPRAASLSFGTLCRAPLGEGPAVGSAVSLTDEPHSIDELSINAGSGRQRVTDGPRADDAGAELISPFVLCRRRVGPRWWRSDHPTPLFNTTDEQSICLFEPPLLAIGGHVRLSLHGAWQSCTLPGHEQERYICLAHVNVVGSRVPWLQHDASETPRHPIWRICTTDMLLWSRAPPPTRCGCGMRACTVCQESVPAQRRAMMASWRQRNPDRAPGR